VRCHNDPETAVRWTGSSLRFPASASANQRQTVVVPRFDLMARPDSIEPPHDPRKPHLLMPDHKELAARSEPRPAPRMIECFGGPLICASRSRLPNGNSYDERAFELQSSGSNLAWNIAGAGATGISRSCERGAGLGAEQYRVGTLIRRSVTVDLASKH